MKASEIPKEVIRLRRADELVRQLLNLRAMRHAIESGNRHYPSGGNIALVEVKVSTPAQEYRNCVVEIDDAIASFAIAVIDKGIAEITQQLTVHGIEFDEEPVTA